MKDFNVNAFKIFEDDWALAAAGVEGDYNAMTIAWGGLGTLWGRPAATVYVKKNRYTHDFMEKNDWFTVSFFPEKYRKALGYMGAHSGRDGDKAAAAGLTPVYLDNAVTFREASVTLLCRKMYAHDFDVDAVPADVKETYYRTEPAHTMYVGEVVEILK